MEASGNDDLLTSLGVLSVGSYVPEFPQKDTKGLWIFGESESKRRVVLIERQNGSFGFTLQSYGVRYKHGHRGDTDFITYVNAVEKNGAAEQAGLREGDVILSINGQNMARVEHKSLVTFIRQCPTTLKMVVVSDERARKVELHMRLVHLQKKLQDKLTELEDLNTQEKQLLAGNKSPCNGNGIGGGPCFSAAASAVCCFCPPHSQPGSKKKEEFRDLVVINPGPSTATISILKPKSDLEEAKLQYAIQQRSKSVKLPSSTEKPKASGNCGNADDAYYYDSYRKCQSSRELNRKDSGGSGTGHRNPNTPTHHHHFHRAPDKSAGGQSPKPVSWDSLIGSGTTKSFGGYGYGYGYGYFPNTSAGTGKEGDAPMSAMTHPHHHNHHSHAQHCSNTQDFYKSRQQDKHAHAPPDASKVKVVYNYVAPTYHTLFPNSTTHPHPSSLSREEQGRRLGLGLTSSSSSRNYASATSQAEKQQFGMGQRSKTLPSTKGSAGGSVAPVNPNAPGGSGGPLPGGFPGAKLEKTFSDSSLSEHCKEFSLAYFQRSGDNVRFSSEEDFDSIGAHGGRNKICVGGRSKSSKPPGKARERIFV